MSDKEHDSDAEVTGAVEDRADQLPRPKKSTEVDTATGADRTLARKSDSAEGHPRSQPVGNPLDHLLLRQLASSVPGDLTDASAIDGAVNRYLAFEPADAVESVLALLAVCVTNSAMDGMGRASRAGLNPVVRQMELKLAYMGSAIGIDVLKALQSHRGSGDQKVSVSNVNVASGGQAIVGHVKARRRKQGEER
jgi:hypothetical protein